ncbi:DUF5117 domain-containing protein [bacterium]|nr:DUF5117 domain-containing protein [bacterium]
MKRTWFLSFNGLAVLLMMAGLPVSTVQAQSTPPTSAPRAEFPPHTQVLADYNKVVSTSDGARSMYTLYQHKTEPKLLAELPASFASQKYFLALTTAGGDRFAGLQEGDLYFYWRQFGKRLAMMQPNVEVRSNGDPESRASVKRLFTDRLVLDTQILTKGPTGGPVIDLTSILVNNSSTFFGTRFSSPYLISISTAKAFPENIEVAIEGPTSRGGIVQTLHYSFSVLNPNPKFRPREADARVGYFTTSYVDLGKYKDTETRVRYINRWHLEKRDPSLKLSPPVKPITFILEHTVPVRYRRWVTQGIEYWNKAYEKVGFLNAIEVDYQDAQTGRNMGLDPEDVRYNFIRWLNNDIGTAIGPSRVNPMTGEILDADIILTDGWIRHYFQQFDEILPAVAMEGFGPETLAWLAENPRWDPRLRLASAARRPEIAREIQRQSMLPLSGHPIAKVDSQLLGDDEYDGLIGRTSQVNGLCLATQGKTLDIALAAIHFALLDADKDKKKKKKDDEDDDKKDVEKKNDEEKKDADEKKDDEKKEEEKKDDEKAKPKSDEQKLDEMPESFIGPLIAELVAHEVGHTLGLRHNFKASSIYSFEEMNSDEVIGRKPLAGSVMDYLPINLRADKTKKQGDWSMIGIGPYDEWAIEYGYTLSSDLKSILARVNEPELIYGTDEETGGPDPRSRRYDFTKEPLDYANNQMELIQHERQRLVGDFVKDGESWARARWGYTLTLSLQSRAVSMMANWLGGAFTSRSLKGDKDAPEPVIVVPAQQQKDALKFVIENTFFDDAFGLNPELLAHLTVDKWLDGDGFAAFNDEATWPVHDKIIGIQASTLTMIMNPTTLRRIYDNELRVPADQDALTLPEVLRSLTDAIWQEVEKTPDKQYTDRVPLVSSLRRNLQEEHLQRLIDLSVPGSVRTEADKPITNLASFELNRIRKRIEQVLKGRDRIDAYTLSHLEKLIEQIDKRQNAEFIYNAKDVGGGGSGGIILLFGDEKEKSQLVPATPDVSTFSTTP